MLKRDVPYNAEELATFDEAVAIRKTLNYSAVFYKLGLQILPWWNNPTPDKSGIYLPPWAPGPHGDPEPNSGQALFYHFRWSNGMEGMNVGLVRGLFARYPASPLYVMNQLLLEVQGGARS